MRRLGRALKLILAVVIVTAGCASRDLALRPPKHAEDIAVPPLADGKFSKPPDYPAGTLNQGDASQGRNRPGARPNMNAMGGGMGGMNSGMNSGMGMPGANGSLGQMGGMGMGGMGMGR